MSVEYEKTVVYSFKMFRFVFFSSLFFLSCSSSTNSGQKQGTPTRVETEKKEPIKKQAVAKDDGWRTLDLSQTISDFSGIGFIRVPAESVVLNRQEIPNVTERTLLLIQVGGEGGLELYLQRPRHDRPINTEQAFSAAAKEHVDHQRTKDGFVVYQKFEDGMRIHGYYSQFDCQAKTSAAYEADIAFKICTSYVRELDNTVPSVH